jgi:beta-glucosidase
MRKLLTIVAALACALTAGATAADQAKVEGGTLEGTVNSDSSVRIFRGVPFAAPPVGNLRWQPPQPVPAWSGVRKADEFGGHCVQGKVFGDINSRGKEMSEDCLYLTVWAPAKITGKPLPVYVWFYGGGFAAGSGDEPRYDGESFAKRGIVVVNANYRLGVFGFLAHPGLTSESTHKASGNYGLLDQVAALEWVRRNIAAFGGDPRRVTIGGESAGSLSVSALMASPLSRELFQQAVGESGAFFGAVGGRGSNSLADSEKQGAAFAASMGVNSIAEMRAKSADDLLSAAMKTNNGFGFWPNVDGYFLPAEVESIFAEGKQSQIPLLAGWNADEVRMQVTMAKEKPTAKTFPERLRQQFKDNAGRALNVYPATTDEEAVRSAGDLASDNFIVFGTWKWIEMQAKTGQPVYRFQFDRAVPIPDAMKGIGLKTLGAAHAAELEYVFNMLQSKKADWQPDDQKVAEAMNAYWANFIKTGDPSGPGLAKWPNYTKTHQVMHIDTESKARPEEHRDRYEFLDSLQAGAVLAQPGIPTVTGNARVDKLLSQMTLEEKIAMIHGAAEPPATDQGQPGFLPGVPRLGIPALRMADGPPGVLTRVPSTAPTSTMGLAATFSREDAEQNGVVIGRDARALGIDVVLQPFINIDRDITFGRGYNTYGEDPVLTGQIGAAMIRGVQSQGIMAQAKHYVAYDGGDDNIVDQQALHEIYVAPFADAVAAGVSSIMCSYNKVNGPWACGNGDTEIKILKDEIGFPGFITSDWGATHGTDFINQGLDLEMPGTSGFIPAYFLPEPPPPYKPPAGIDMGDFGFGAAMPEEPPPVPFDFSSFSKPAPAIGMLNALKSGLVKEETITRAVGRILYEMDKFGLLDGRGKHDVTPVPVDADAVVVRKTGGDAAVLLKNDGGALPLRAADLASLAMIGPGALQTVAVGEPGEKSLGIPARQIGAVEALRKLAPNARVTYAAADDMNGVPVPASALSHDGKPGLLSTNSRTNLTEVSAQVDFTEANGKALPAGTSWKWAGTLTVPSAGSYLVNLQLLGTVGTLVIDGKRVSHTGDHMGNMHGNVLHAGEHNIVPTPDGLDNMRRPVTLAAGAHSITLTSTADVSGEPVQIRLSWVTPEQQKSNYGAAIAAAKQAKTAIVFAWSRGRPVFGIPGNQNQLIEDIAAVNPNTIVVLNVSQPVALPWLSKVKAVLQMWFPGDEGGWATADVLLGRVSPAGRLPFTWMKTMDQAVANDPAHPERSSKGVQGKTTYAESVNVGYRWFDKNHIEPLFPFGYGQSYAKFEYSALNVKRADDGGLDVSFQLHNAGGVASDEVPQVYLAAPSQLPTGAQFAQRALAAFDRVNLQAGETKDVTIHIPLRRLQYWSVAQSKWALAAGPRVVHVGSSSRNLRLHAETDIE